MQGFTKKSVTLLTGTTSRYFWSNSSLYEELANNSFFLAQFYNRELHFAVLPFLAPDQMSYDRLVKTENDEYTTLEGLLYKSSMFPGSALFEIVASGVPASKLVIGKPAMSKDAPSGGYMKPELLANCLKEAKGHDKGWGKLTDSFDVNRYSFLFSTIRWRSRGLAGMSSQTIFLHMMSDD